MLNVDVRPVLGKHTSRYSLVSAVAKHARSLVDEAEGDRRTLLGKPVTLSLNDFLEHRYAVLETEHVRENRAEE
ncbi:MAG: DNA-directed RNA polymerase subunit omega [Oscillospiraceae bacterium]|jgi:DNA-directed RNA polymerase subunit K/omega|nr:DNA-directed RNA polymerase subunit omega [Oscillospiraceae bacterium]